jgi:hypothetical protein
MKTTLNKIKAFNPCKDGWEKLLTYLNKTESDDEELSLLTILKSNGFDHALWALRTLEGFDKEKRLMACDFAESVVHLAKDERSVNAIKVSRNYANGIATKEELTAARCDAADAHDDAASFAAYAAWCATFDIALSAYAAAASDAEKEKQITIFEKYIK